MFLFSQPPIPPLPSSLNLSGRTIIITGGARGIGYTASLQLLRHRASTIILGVRDINNGKAAAASLLADAEVRRLNPHARIELLRLDLSSFASVRSFVSEVEEKAKSVDVLLLNAGVNLARWEVTEDGYEMYVVSFLS